MKQLSETLAKQNQRLALDGIVAEPRDRRRNSFHQRQRRVAAALRFAARFGDWHHARAARRNAGQKRRQSGEKRRGLRSAEARHRRAWDARRDHAGDVSTCIRCRRNRAQFRAWLATLAKRNVSSSRFRIPSSLTLRCKFASSSRSQPQIDVLFEATEAGCAAQAEQLKKHSRPCDGDRIWTCRVERAARTVLGSDCEVLQASAVAKISVLPTQIAEAYEADR